ncbi:hypothetical protein Tco_0185327 [Tanacetum coccineum]
MYDINTPRDEITRDQENRKQYRVFPGRYVPTRLKWKIEKRLTISCSLCESFPKANPSNHLLCFFEQSHHRNGLGESGGLPNLEMWVKESEGEGFCQVVDGVLHGNKYVIKNGAGCFGVGGRGSSFMAIPRLQKCVGLVYNRGLSMWQQRSMQRQVWLKRTKHIDIRYHWIRDAIEDGMFELNKVHTDNNAPDMLTKAVAREKLKIYCSFAGMANSSS